MLRYESEGVSTSRTPVDQIEKRCSIKTRNKNHLCPLLNLS